VLTIDLENVITFQFDKWGVMTRVVSRDQLSSVAAEPFFEAVPEIYNEYKFHPDCHKGSLTVDFMTSESRVAKFTEGHKKILKIIEDKKGSPLSDKSSSSAQMIVTPWTKEESEKANERRRYVNERVSRFQWDAQGNPISEVQNIAEANAINKIKKVFVHIAG
jgi:hypothetical protein